MIFKYPSVLGAAALLSLSACPLLAQNASTLKVLTLAIANELALTVIKQCKTDGYRVSVVVADGNGTPMVILRGDGTGPHTVDSARRKAYTAASMRTSTAELAERLAKNPGSAALATLPDVLPLAGGLPIKVGDSVIGAAGVGGAPGGDKDAACAQAGIDAISDKLK